MGSQPPQQGPDRKAPTPGLSETPAGLRWYDPDLHVLIDVNDLTRNSQGLNCEVTVRCSLPEVKTQVDGRMRQGNFNVSAMRTRAEWAKALGDMTPAELRERFAWDNVIERLCQEVLDWERVGKVKGGLITGARIGPEGRPWAAWPILPHGETATIFARGGAGKTSLVYTVVLSSALGRSLIEGVRIDRPYRVLILDWETNGETANDVLGIIADSNGVAIPGTIWYEPMDQPIERSTAKIATVIERHRADYVVVDSVSMAMVAASEGDPSTSITRMHQALRRLGTWGLLIDHVASADMRSRKVAVKAYGSVFKTNLARHAVTLHIGGRSGDVKQAYLLCPKSNVGRDHWAMAGTVTRNDSEIRWGFGDPDFDLYDRLMTQSEGEEAAYQSDDEVDGQTVETPAFQRDLYLQALYDSYPGGLTVAAIHERVGATSATYVRKVLNSLSAKGLVVQSDLQGRAKVWCLTADGVETVHPSSADG